MRGLPKTTLSLAAQVPVYRDEDGEFRSQWSDYSSSYDGNRVFLEDNERKVELQRLDKTIASKCSGEKDLEKQGQALLGELKQRRCAQAKQDLAEKEKAQARTPSSVIREAKRLVDVSCSSN